MTISTTGRSKVLCSFASHATSLVKHSQKINQEIHELNRSVLEAIENISKENLYDKLPLLKQHHDRLYTWIKDLKNINPSLKELNRLISAYKKFEKKGVKSIEAVEKKPQNFLLKWTHTLFRKLHVTPSFLLKTKSKLLGLHQERTSLLSLLNQNSRILKCKILQILKSAR